MDGQMGTFNFDFLGNSQLPPIHCLEDLLKREHNLVRTNEKTNIDSSPEVNEILGLNTDSAQILRGSIDQLKTKEQSINELIYTINILNSFNQQKSDLCVSNLTNLSNLTNFSDSKNPSENLNSIYSQKSSCVNSRETDLKLPSSICPTGFNQLFEDVANINGGVSLFEIPEKPEDIPLSLSMLEKPKDVPFSLSSAASDLYALLGLPFLLEDHPNVTNFDNKNGAEIEPRKYNRRASDIDDVVKDCSPYRKNTSAVKITPQNLGNKRTPANVRNTGKRPTKKTIESDSDQLRDLTDIFQIGSKTCPLIQMNAKNGRQRILFQRSTVQILENKFKVNQYLSNKERIHLAETLQITSNQVKIWFQNKRYKMKKRLL